TRDMMKVLEQYPNYAPAHFQAAILFQNTSPQLAVEHFNKAIELAPEQVEYRRRLAEFYMRHSRFSEAEEIGKQLLLNPKREEIGYIVIARTKTAEGNTARAARILEQAIDKIGDSEDLL